MAKNIRLNYSVKILQLITPETYHKGNNEMPKISQPTCFERKA